MIRDIRRDLLDDGHVRGNPAEDLEQHADRVETGGTDTLLLQARLDALQSQINPHFLFNTLNSVSSLVRVDPILRER